MPVLLVLPVFVLLAAILSGEARIHKLILSVLGIAGGIFWFARFETQTLFPVYGLDGITETAVIRCNDYPEATDYGYRVKGCLELDGKQYSVMCYLDGSENPEPGMLLSGNFRFCVTAPGGRKESTYYQGDGVFLLAYQSDEIVVSSGEKTWEDYPPKLRRKVIHVLEASLPDDAFPFAKALLFGDTSSLDYQTKTDFSVSGIRHVVAVSGLHVSILFSLLHFLSFRKRFLSALLALPVLLLFAAVTGFTPSVSRACIMCGLMLLSWLVNREYDGITALSFGGLVLLLINPLVIVSVSYQLSFASVAGIFLFSTPIYNWLLSWIPRKFAGDFSRYLISSVSVTLGATVLTVPLCSLYFGTVSLAAMLTNLLVLWMVSVIFYGLIALCLLYSCCPGAALLLGKGLAILIRYVLFTAKIIAAFPLAAVYTRSPYVCAWLVFAYLLLAAFLVSRNRTPVELSCCVLLGLCCTLAASWVEPLLDETRFTMLDVGQGQCLLLQAEGKSYMVDCGGSSDASAADAAAETLLSQGVFCLDGIIVTHYDRDHAGGLSNFLHRVDTELLILPPVYTEESYPAARTIWGSEDLVVTSGDTKIHIFASKIPGNDNENSLCVLFDTANCDILVTGDRSAFGERSLLRHANIPDVDVLVAGHHGSGQATCEELLTAARPEIVCISAGKNNVFGHPAPELLERLKKFGCSVYRTDLHGDIIIRR